VRVELGNSGAGGKDLNRIVATETLAGQNLSLKGTGKEGTVEFEIPLPVDEHECQRHRPGSDGKTQGQLEPTRLSRPAGP
jgi:hypothetical protein